MKNPIVLSLFFLASLQASAQDSAPTSRPRLETVLESLRAGNWSPEAYDEAMVLLSIENAPAAMEWWSIAAEKVAAKGKLPPKTKEAIKAQRKKIEALSRADKDAKSAWSKAGELVRTLIGRKLPESASKALGVSESLAAVYRHESWEKEVEDLRKRIAKLPAPSATEVMKDTETKLLDDLKQRVVAALDRVSHAEVEQFTRFGHPEGYRRLKHGVLIRPVDDASHADLIALNQAARKLGMGKKLVLEILGQVDTVVRQDGEIVKSGDSETTSGERRAPIELLVLPGEKVTFVPEHSAAAKRGFGAPSWFELYLHASLDGVDLPITAFRTVVTNKGKTLTSRLMVAAIGETSKVIVDGKPMIAMNYHDPVKGRTAEDDTIYIDVNASPEEMAAQILGSLIDPRTTAYNADHQAIEALVAGDRSKFTWTLVWHEKPSYYLQIPDPDVDAAAKPK